MLCCVQGLSYLHSCGIVHGDLKPANVLMDDSNADRRGFIAKLSDFGLCHLLSGNTSLHTETWGTVHFMAPEHMAGRVTHAADIYSFGMCLMQMLTGVQPYLDITPRE